MKAFRKFAARWPVSALCIAALILPITGAIFTPIPASAQTGTIEIAVVDFRNSSKMPNDMYGTNATAAVTVELLRSGKFSVTSTDDMQSKMEELGYKATGDRALKVSLTPSMMMRLGQDVGATCVAIGDLSSIKVDVGKRNAEARIAVRLLDVSSGEWVNGAIATGTSNPRIGYTVDNETDWVMEAISNAAHSAVDTMVRYIIPEATVIGTVGTSDVLLNKGSQDGIAEGLEMIVLRRGDTGQDEVVGRIKVSMVTDTDARASVTKSTRGVKPEDRVRAVYELPIDSSSKGTVAPRSGEKKRMAKASNTFWGILALLAISTIFGGGGSKVESVRATAMARTTESGNNTILVLWNNPHDVLLANIEEYHIFRGSPGGTPVYVAEQGEGTVDGDFDHSYDDDINSRPDLAYGSVGPGNTLVDNTATPPGITLGTTYTYYVSCLYRYPVTSAEGTVTYSYRETTPVYAEKATALMLPRQVSPGNLGGGDTVDIADTDGVRFDWEGSKGANEYVIEICPNPNFTRNETWVGHSPIQFTDTEGKPRYATFDLSAASELENVAEESTLYWRVGARNSGDTPGPYPAGPSTQASGAKSTRYIYSEYPYSFLTLGGVPPPP